VEKQFREEEEKRLKIQEQLEKQRLLEEEERNKKAE